MSSASIADVSNRTPAIATVRKPKTKGGVIMVKIITFQPQYRDDMLFCFLSAKDALGRVTALREDLAQQFTQDLTTII
jgi:hypothetical protein